jgi:hypothetical protein
MAVFTSIISNLAVISVEIRSYHSNLVREPKITTNKRTIKISNTVNLSPFFELDNRTEKKRKKSTIKIEKAIAILCWQSIAAIKEMKAIT